MAGLECVLTPLQSGSMPLLQPPLCVGSWDTKEEQHTLKGTTEIYFLIVPSHPFPFLLYRDSNVVSALESLIDVSCDSSDVHLSDCDKASVTGCNVAGGVECLRTSRMCCKMKAL